MKSFKVVLKSGLWLVLLTSGATSATPALADSNTSPALEAAKALACLSVPGCPLYAITSGLAEDAKNQYLFYKFEKEIKAHPEKWLMSAKHAAVESVADGQAKGPVSAPASAPTAIIDDGVTKTVVR